MDEHDLLPDLPNEGLLRVDVTGRSADLWREVRPKLIRAVVEVIKSVAAERDASEILWDGAKDLVAGAFDHLKARLAKTGLENAKIEAEVCKLYADAEARLMEARSQASERDFNTAVKRLRVALGLTKAMLVGETGEEAVLFGQQIEAMMVALKEVAG